jgi:putative methyltransferase (TIGR04325 family)
VLAASLAVDNGTAVHERDSVIFDQIHYAWPVLAALMWSAARNNGSLRVLDLGGSLGTTYRQNRRFLAELPDVSWAVVEQASFVAAGKEYFADARLRFYESIMDAAAACQPQVGLVSSSLQYLTEPVSALEQLSATGAQILILDRTPIHHGSTDRIALQHVPSTIYSATYPARIFSKPRLITTLERLGWKVLEEFETLERESVTNSGFKFTWFGITLTRTEGTSP